ncbi:MAG: amidohydrolase [Verrucomicrobia bacterium]|nr:amidohydrolase [Verrucomicrobiota bacterium]
MRIDSHQHFWSLGMFPHSWITPQLKPIHRSFGPDDLKPLLDACRLDGSVLVQTFSSLEETRWFLTLASQHDFIRGVVGWVDLTDPDVEETIDGLKDHPKFCGIRHVVHDEPDAGWLCRKDVLAGLAALARMQVPFDLLIKPPHLSAALQVAEANPTLRLVVDHIAKPRIAEGGWDDWADGIARLAGHSNVWCKLSGMITEASWTGWKSSDLKRYVTHVVNIFGPERCMYGSDWPVCLLAGSYEDAFRALEESLPSLDEAALKGIWGENAASFYRLS